MISRTEINRTYTVYKHTAPSGKVYIGITSQKPKERWQGGKNYKNKYFQSAIKKYGWENIKHEILYSGLTKEEAEQKERELIAFYKSTDRQFGYNILSGGNVSNGGWIPDEEYRKRVSERRKGHKMSAVEREHNQANWESRRKPVKQYDINGNYIATYESVTKAEKATGISNSNISACCKGNYNSTHGFIFKYANDNKDVCQYHGRQKGVCQYTLDGEYIKTYPKIVDAAEAVHTDRSLITSVCKFKSVSCAGYLWVYDTEPERILEKLIQYQMLPPMHRKRKRNDKKRIDTLEKGHTE